MILFLHAALFVALSSFSLASVISLLHATFPLRFCRPLLLFPGMFTSSMLLTMCSSFILITWPYHFSCIYLVISVNLITVCACSKSFLLSTGGFTCVAFVAGALALWAPLFMEYAIFVQDQGHTMEELELR